MKNEDCERRNGKGTLTGLPISEFMGVFWGCLAALAIIAMSSVWIAVFITKYIGQVTR